MWLLTILACSLSLVLTGVLRRYALARHVMDLPSARSAHSVATPRGGGMAVVFSFLLCAALPLFQSPLLSLWQPMCGLILVALVGFVDDHRSLPARWRLIVHIAAALLVIAGVGIPSQLIVAGWVLPLGVMGWPLFTLGLVWFINLYNFMDGIDGLAAGEALVVGVAIAIIHLFSDTGLNQVGMLALLLAASASGFLAWNLPPARIFMGDGCSGFLGLLLGMLMLLDLRDAAQSLWVWIILLGVFIVDATLTLLIRFYRGCVLSAPHRSHAYQHAARQCGHGATTVGALLITILWLAPLAWAVSTLYLEGATAALLAYVPLCVMAFYLGAGRE